MMTQTSVHSKRLASFLYILLENIEISKGGGNYKINKENGIQLTGGWRMWWCKSINEIN